jgi:hypothetical protein
VAEQERHDLTAVHGGVMDLGHDGGLPALDPFDEHELPQGLRPLQRSAREVPDEVRELAQAPGRGDGGAAQVVVEVERGILDPVRLGEPERILDETAPQGREQVEAPLEDAPHHREEWRAGRRFQDHDAHGVQGHLRRLRMEHSGIEAGHTLHREPSLSVMPVRRRGHEPSAPGWKAQGYRAAAVCRMVTQC